MSSKQIDKPTSTLTGILTMTAQEQYQIKLAEVQNLTSLLANKVQLKENQKNANWAHVGDLNRLIESLKEIHEYL